MKRVCLALALAGTLGLTGCADLGYGWRAASAHLQLLQAAQPVDALLADRATDARLRQALERAQGLRDFAVTELGLPDGASYRRYADLGRPSVVWNVVAAPPDSLALKTWCFPVAGCVSYRGHPDEARARAEAQALAAQGLEVSVYGVPAYSTLRRLEWLGGDPLLNTFIHWPEGDLARLMFHELAHQVLYVSDDTVFNESFATAVERIGAARWLATRPAPVREADARQQARRAEFRALTRSVRAELQEVFAHAAQGRLDAAARDASKAAAYARLRRDWAALRARWLADSPGMDERSLAGWDAWVASANNASLAAQGAYDELVPAFEALHARSGSLPRFYDEVRALTALPREARRAALTAPRSP